MKCNNEDHERFRGVMFAMNGCLACEVEKLIEEKDCLVIDCKRMQLVLEKYKLVSLET